MGFINSFLREVAPRLAVRRIQNQAAFDVLSKGARKFEGAGRGRRFSDNSLQYTSANYDIGNALPMLRKRSRDANNNNPYAKNGTRRIANNVIGTGIMANPVSDNKLLQESVKKLFNKWADTTYCDFDDLQNFYGIQHLVTTTIVKSGECIIRRVWKKRSKNSPIVPLEIQVLDPDFLDHGKTSLALDSDGGYILHGIQYSSIGKRTHYWIFDRHPSEAAAVSKPIPAKDIAHAFQVEEPGQNHGVPFNSSILLRMQDFDEYEDAQLMKQKIAACFAGFITTDSIGAGLNAPEVDQSDMTERFQPGTYQRLSPGETIQFANPPTTDGFRDFSRQSLQGQAAGMGMSYESFSGDLSGVNFSSGRMGWLEFQRGIEILQWNMIIPMFLNKVWDWFLEAAVTSGKIESNDISVQWTAPRREMIDPLKEVQALLKSVRAGFLSWQDAVRQLGYNPDEIAAQMKQDKDRFDKDGLMPESDPRYDADKLAKTDSLIPQDKEE